MTASVPLLDAVDDVSAGNKKLLQSEFRPVGSLAVVDQGKDLIAGYTDDMEAAVHTDGPLIVFGDHTRNLKFVDFPFAMGADGIRVFKPREGFYPKYLYRYMEAHPVPSAGYSRHFKFLKELQIARPDLTLQRRIAAILDDADMIRSKRKAVLAQLDSLTQALFAHTFTEDAELLRAGDVMTNLRNGMSPATVGAYPAAVLSLSAVTQGAFDPTAVKAGFFVAEPSKDRRVSSTDFLMCRGNGNRNLVGVGAYSMVDRPDLVFPDTVIAGRIDANRIVMPYLNACWKTPEVRRQIEAVARTTNGTFKVNQQTLAAITIPVPPLGVQQAFATRVARIDTARATVQRALAADDELFASLQSRAFSGKL